MNEIRKIFEQLADLIGELLSKLGSLTGAGDANALSQSPGSGAADDGMAVGGPAPTSSPDDLVINNRPPPGILEMIQQASFNSGISFRMLSKIAFIESSYRVGVVGPEKRDKSVGLMQIRPSVARVTLTWAGYHNVPSSNEELTELLKDPEVNLLAASTLLADIKRKHPEAADPEVLAQVYHLGEPAYFGRGERSGRYVQNFRNA